MSEIKTFPLYLPKRRYGLLQFVAPLTQAEYDLLVQQINNALVIVRELWIVEVAQPPDEARESEAQRERGAVESLRAAVAQSWAEASNRAVKAEADARRLRHLLAKALPHVEAHYEEYYQGTGEDIRPEIQAVLTPEARESEGEK